MSTGIIRRVDSSGDTVLAEWETTDKASVKHAEEVFDAEAAKHGVMSRCDEGTDLTGEKITRFDPEAREILSFGRPVGG
jgi:hypothetical protein